MQRAHLIMGKNAQIFIKKIDKEQSLLVYFYHRNSRQVPAEFFSGNGFIQVYTLDGGFDIWRAKNN